MTTDPYKPLRRLMRSHVDEYRDVKQWGALYQSVRDEHIRCYLENAPEGADIVVTDAISGMVRGPGYVKPRAMRELIQAVTSPTNGACYSFLHVALVRELAPQMESLWRMALAVDADDEPDAHDPLEAREPHG